MRRGALKEIANRTDFSNSQVMSFYSAMRSAGRKVQLTTYNSPYDLLVDGWRIEHKAARPAQKNNGGMVWLFNIHRYGILKEECDFYALCLAEIPFSKNTINILLPSPLDALTVVVGYRQLLAGVFADGYKTYEKLRSGEFGVGPFAALQSRKGRAA